MNNKIKLKSMKTKKSQSILVGFIVLGGIGVIIDTAVVGSPIIIVTTLI